MLESASTHEQKRLPYTPRSQQGHFQVGVEQRQIAVGFRVVHTSPKMLQQLDRIAKRRNRNRPCPHVTRSAIARELVEEGLRLMKERAA